MKRTLLSLLGILLLCTLFAGSAFASRAYFATCLTGGGSCLDGIDAADTRGDSSNITLEAGDWGLVVYDYGSTTPRIYFFRVYSSGASESIPDIIAPDSNPGNLRWHRAEIVIGTGTASTYTLTGDVSGTDTSLTWGDTKLTYNGDLYISRSSADVHLFLNHTGEANAGSAIIFQDDGSDKAALIFDTAGVGTYDFGYYDSTNTAWRFKISAAGLISLLGSTTIGAGSSATHTLTFDVSGTDPVLTGGDNSLSTSANFTAGSVSTGSTGVSITGSNGVLTIAGTGDGQDENLTFDFNSTADVVTIGTGTSVGAIATTLSIVTTGTVSGALRIVTKTSAYTLGTDSTYEPYGSAVFLTGTTTLTLPAAVAGMNFCVYSDDAAVKTIEPNGSDVITLDGTALTGGYNITSDGAKGDFICLVSKSANNWASMGSGLTAWNPGS